MANLPLDAFPTIEMPGRTERTVSTCPGATLQSDTEWQAEWESLPSEMMAHDVIMIDVLISVSYLLVLCHLYASDMARKRAVASTATRTT